MLICFKKIDNIPAGIAKFTKEKNTMVSWIMDR